MILPPTTSLSIRMGCGLLSSVKLILQGKNFEEQSVYHFTAVATSYSCYLVREVDVIWLRWKIWERPQASKVTFFAKKHAVVGAEEDAESMFGSIDLVASIILRKIKEKDSDHGRQIKAFDRLTFREAGALIVAEEEEEEIEEGLTTVVKK